MQRQRLLDTLDQLQAELARTEGVDAGTQARLRALTEELRQRTAEGDKPSSAEADPDSGVLNDLLLKFEGDHPQLAAAVGRVADALAAMGI